jgi:hypothetical protein
VVDRMSNAIDEPTTNRFCPSCGTEVAIGSSFCVGCGQPISAIDGIADGALTIREGRPAEELDPPVSASPAKVNPPKDNDTLTGLAVVLAVVFWPAGIVVGHYARRKIRRTGQRGAGTVLAGLIISYVVGAITIIVLVLMPLFSSPSSGFNDISTLQSSVAQQVNTNLHNPANAGYSAGTSVKSTICVHNSGTQFSCDLKLSDSTNLPVSVTVSSDGTRWVSNT